MSDSDRVVVVGGGLAGLSCAVRLHEAGREVVLLEAGDGVGGRVRTDEVDGFLLDRGFQVFLDAYAEAGEFLDLEALELGGFEPGALIWGAGRMRRMMDVFRRPMGIFATLMSGIGGVGDKLLVAKLRGKLRKASVEEIWGWEDVSTEKFLKDFGFSDEMVDVFFRSFYGGIFLERELRTSCRMFCFTFKMFSEGRACLPREGMGAIPAQLLGRLPEGCVRLGARVVGVDGVGVTLEGGEHVPAGRVMLAVDGGAADSLLGDGLKSMGWRGVFCVYFSADVAPVDEGILVLNGHGNGLVNHVCVPSQVCGSYAPEGKHLISVSLLGEHDVDGLAERVRYELMEWFGSGVLDWEHLRTYEIRKGLPENLPGMERGVREVDGVLVCGDFCESASIEGAVRSGLKAAELILS